MCLLILGEAIIGYKSSTIRFSLKSVSRRLICSGSHFLLLLLLFLVGRGLFEAALKEPKAN